MLAIAIIVEDYIIYSSSPENKIINTNWILIINSLIAASLAVLVVSREKFSGPHAKTHVAIAIGLILWLSANITWGSYEREEIVPPVPSIADGFWLSAYPFFAYYLFMTYREFDKKFQNKKVVLSSVCFGIIFVAFMIFFTRDLSVFDTTRGMAMFAVIIAYPILNTILIVPAIIMLMGFRKEPHSYYSMDMRIIISCKSYHN